MDFRDAFKGRFLFRGNAVGAAVVNSKQSVETDRDGQPTVHASCSLPVIGGLAVSEASRKRGGIRFDAMTKAHGYLNTETKLHETVVTASVTNLQTKVVTASCILASLKTTQSRDRYGTLSIKPLDDTRIEGMEVFGKPIKIHYDRELISLDTKEKVDERYSLDNAFRDNYIQRFFPTVEPPRRFPSWIRRRRIPTVQGALVFSIVSKITWADPDQRDPRVSFHDHIIHIRGFGDVFLGEVVRNRNSCRLTLVRMNLHGGDDQHAEEGSHVHTLDEVPDGDAPQPRPLMNKTGPTEAAFGEVESNGMEIPPD